MLETIKATKDGEECLLIPSTINEQICVIILKDGALRMSRIQDVKIDMNAINQSSQLKE